MLISDSGTPLNMVPYYNVVLTLSHGGRALLSFETSRSACDRETCFEPRKAATNTRRIGAAGAKVERRATLHPAATAQARSMRNAPQAGEKGDYNEEEHVVKLHVPADVEL